MPKKIEPSKLMEWAGLDRIQTIVHSQLKHIFREISKDDLGIDGEIELLKEKENGGFETTGQFIKVQAKAGASYIGKEDKTTFEVKVSRADLEYWNSANLPVLFIIYNPKADKLFYVNVKNYIKKTPDVWKPPYRLEISKENNVFDASARNLLADIGRESEQKITRKQKERLYSNVLRATGLPKVYELSNRITTTGMPIEKAPYVYEHHGKQYTILDNVDSGDHVICNPLTEEQLLHIPRYRALISYFVNLVLAKNLDRQGLDFYAPFKRYYFRQDKKQPLKKQRNWFNPLTKQSSRRTVYKKYTYGRKKPFSFWRHLGARIVPEFLRDQIFLRITPEFFFTVNGRMPLQSNLVGPMNTKVKALRNNKNFLGDILFWCSVLNVNDNPKTFTIRLLGKNFLTFESIPVNQETDFAVLDDPVENYDNDNSQLEFFDV